MLTLFNTCAGTRWMDELTDRWTGLFESFYKCTFFTLIFAVLLVGINLYTRSEYFTIPISVLKFNFPPLIVRR